MARKKIALIGAGQIGGTLALLATGAGAQAQSRLGTTQHQKALNTTCYGAFW